MLYLVMIIISGLLCMSLKLQSILFCGTFVLPELKLLLLLAYSGKRSRITKHCDLRNIEAFLSRRKEAHQGTSKCSKTSKS